MSDSIAQLPVKAGRLAWRALSYQLAPLMGQRSRFGIHPGYTHRPTVSYFDDTENTDNWQLEVYECARDVMRRESLATVNDVGCGSGYKLVHLLSEFETTGIDLPDTIGEVARRYPDRNWIAGSFEEIDVPPADLVICSDVIEHVADPDALMRFIVRSSNSRVVLSTPDRDLVYGWRNRHRFGPPENPAHVREWNMAEFAGFVSRYLEVEKHFISNREQATQCIVGRKPVSPSATAV